VGVPVMLLTQAGFPKSLGNFHFNLASISTSKIEENNAKLRAARAAAEKSALGEVKKLTTSVAAPHTSGVVIVGLGQEEDILDFSAIFQQFFGFFLFCHVSNKHKPTTALTRARAAAATNPAFDGVKISEKDLQMHKSNQHSFWVVFFLLAGACNVWHSAWRILYSPFFILGPDFAKPNPTLELLFSIIDFTTAQEQTIISLNDVFMWSGVCVGGLAYWAFGVFKFKGGFYDHPNVCIIFMMLKLMVASSLVNIYAVGRPGPYTLLFGLAEYVWAFFFFLFLRCEGSWKAISHRSKKSKNK